jgi:hypothetical protein
MLLNGIDNPGSQILRDVDIGHGDDDPIHQSLGAKEEKRA